MSGELLAEIDAALAHLVEELARDAGCRWTSHFAHGLAWCRDLRARGGPATGDELAEFRRWLLGPYRGGAGQFNDYVPVVATDRPGVFAAAPWDEAVCAARARVAALAEDLPK